MSESCTCWLLLCDVLMHHVKVKRGQSLSPCIACLSEGHEIYEQTVPSLKLLLHSLFHLKSIFSYRSFSRITYRRLLLNSLAQSKTGLFLLGEKRWNQRTWAEYPVLKEYSWQSQESAILLTFSFTPLFQFYGYRANGYFSLSPTQKMELQPPLKMACKAA